MSNKNKCLIEKIKCTWCFLHTVATNVLNITSTDYILYIEWHIWFPLHCSVLPTMINQICYSKSNFSCANKSRVSEVVVYMIQKSTRFDTVYEFKNYATEFKKIIL